MEKFIEHDIAIMMISAHELSKKYVMGGSTVAALDSVSVSIEAGEFIAIMGPSGSGKSTLMNIFGLLDVPDSGSYQLFGNEVSGLDEDALALLRGKTIGFVFQHFHLIARKTALENVLLPSIYSREKNSLQTAQALLKQVGLGDRMHHKPSELSGGQQQRVAIARSLMNHPQILFADEPTGNLDSKSEEEILKILTDLNRSGMTVILVTHEPEIARYASRIIRMRDGKIQSDEKKQPAISQTHTPSFQTTTPEKTDPKQRFFSPIFSHVEQAFASLLSNKARSLLSMLGILIGVGAVIAMLALGSGAQKSVEAQLSSLGSNLLILRPGAIRSQGVSLGSSSTSRLTLEDARDLKKNISTLKVVAPTVSGRGQIVFLDKNWNTQVQGVTADYAMMRASEPVLGRFFSEEEDSKRARVAVIGKTLVRELFGEKNPLGESVKINRVLFEVVGVLPEKGATSWRDQDDIVLIPLNTAMRRLLGKDYVDSIEMEANSAEVIGEAQTAVEELMNRRSKKIGGQEDAFEVRNMADIQAALSSTSKTLSLLLASIATISLVVGGIGIMNIMLVSVTERTREIGLRKAIGATRKDILMQFLIEATVVSVTGGVLGITLGWVSTTLLSYFSGWAAIVSLKAVGLAFGFSASIGIVFGLWPARKASQLNPIQALRHE